MAIAQPQPPTPQERIDTLLDRFFQLKTRRGLVRMRDDEGVALLFQIGGEQVLTPAGVAAVCGYHPGSYHRRVADEATRVLERELKKRR